MVSLQLLDFWPSIRAWADINFLGHILVQPTPLPPACSLIFTSMYVPLLLSAHCKQTKGNHTFCHMPAECFAAYTHTFFPLPLNVSLQVLWGHIPTPFTCLSAGAEHPAGGEGHAAQAAAPACSSRWRRQARAVDRWAGGRRGRPRRRCGRCCPCCACMSQLRSVPCLQTCLPNQSWSTARMATASLRQVLLLRSSAGRA